MCIVLMHVCMSLQGLVWLVVVNFRLVFISGLGLGLCVCTDPKKNLMLKIFRQKILKYQYRLLMGKQAPIEHF